MARGPRDRQARTDRNDRPDRTDPALANEATESTEASEPADPTDRIDPADPTDRIDPAEPIERIDPADPMDKMDPLDPMLRIDPAERANSRTRSWFPIRPFSQPPAEHRDHERKVLLSRPISFVIMRSPSARVPERRLPEDNSKKSLALRAVFAS
jgi:hypothetical protein